MKKEVSLRQIAYMFIFLTISPIVRQLPNALASMAGRAGYLSPLWALIVLLPFTGILLFLIKSFPGLNFYEILTQLFGQLLAKLVVLFYMLWMLIQLVLKVNIYTLTLQFTLMPKTRSNLVIVIMIILVFYALLRGMKTIFRFAEFVLGPIIFFFVVVFLSAIPKIRLDYLLPVSTASLRATMPGAINVVSVGGILVITLLFADKLNISLSKQQKGKLWYGVLIYILLAIGLTMFTFGVTGADLTSQLSFPLYMAVKSISFFGVAERFEVLITLICVISDFVFICVLSTLLIRCIQWLCNVKDRGFLFLPLTMIVFYLTYFISDTQFEFNFIYRNIMIYLDLIFEYLIPCIMVIFCFIRRKHIRPQY